MRQLLLLLLLFPVLGVSDPNGLPQVRVIGTGGTIASKGTGASELTQYSVALTAKDLVSAVPALDKIARIETEQFSNIDSSNMTVDLWLKLARRVNQALSQEPDLAGVVILHGTDTIEETAYFLHLLVRSEKPVILVGAMRPATALSADGPLNLWNAVRTAISPEARGKGVLVLMNDQISSAREATKHNTYRADAFVAGDFGYLGAVDADRVTFYRTSVRRHTTHSEFNVEQIENLPRVDIVYSYAGADGTVIDALVKAGAKGIVVAGTGAGDMTRGEREAVLRARASGVFMVRGTRVGGGRVIDNGYPVEEGGTNGSHPRTDRIIAADNLTPQKARILLMLALWRTQDSAEIQRIFDEY